MQALAGTKQVYRVPHLLATSLKKRVANKFLTMEDRIPKEAPKVLFTIKLPADFDCQQVNYLDKTEAAGEHEYLFSAYSTFTVESVKRSTGLRIEPAVLRLLCCVRSDRCSRRAIQAARRPTS